MAHGGRSRPDAAFKDAAHSPILVTMEPAIIPEEQRARKRPGRRAAAIQLLVMIAIGGGLAWLKVTAHPPPAGAAGDYAEAQKTEGRSRLSSIPWVQGAIAFRARATDGSQLYVWRTGDRLRVRVDTAPYDCARAGWREWWDTTEHATVRITAHDTFNDVRRAHPPVPAGGIDVLTTAVHGTVSEDRIELRLFRRDDYRSAAGNGICQRSETFIARRSG
jgi:hypothetical protein